MEVFFLKWYTGIKKIAINFLFIPVSNGLAIQIVEKYKGCLHFKIIQVSLLLF